MLSGIYPKKQYEGTKVSEGLKGIVRMKKKYLPIDKVGKRSYIIFTDK